MIIDEIIKMKATDYHGTTKVWSISVIGMVFGYNEQEHKTPQWYIECTEMESENHKTFLLKNCDFTYREELNQMDLF